MNNLSIMELLEHVDPAACSYEEWTEVGMALKHEGFSASDWEAWSMRDPGRYHHGECEKKWWTFNGNAVPVTAGTIYQLAVNQGWHPDAGHELDWDSEISDDGVVVDQNWIEGRELSPAEDLDPSAQLIRYLETLFQPEENVGYVMQSYKNEKGKYVPMDKGSWKRTAGELIAELKKCNGDLGGALGDYDPEGGAWIRFNPLDGEGVRNENVSDYRYALVESDSLDLEKQNAILRELELPIAALVYSGSKSIHAIVKIFASDYQEYRKRVDYLYDICKKNGLEIDTQNRNPSRLSRMPGIKRGDKEQYLLCTNIGKPSWDEWKEWIEGINDDLPDMERLSDVWDSMPDLAPCLIDGVLRQGHKMLIAGPSKAGKSFLLIELAIAIAEGKKWLGWQCQKGKVLYVNLELDRASCLHRFRDVYKASVINPENLNNIVIWNLRGRSEQMDRLAPKLIRRAQKQGFLAIIIDPIYKVITGDENSADQMSKFCNQFDKVCTELGCAVIYCHHHSKGAQGGKKSMDRASGSGVFGRDPDAMLDLIELETTKALMDQEENKAVCKAAQIYLTAHGQSGWEDDLSQDDRLNSGTMLSYCQNTLNTFQMPILNQQVEEARQQARSKTAWRIEGTLREFQRFDPINLWFSYPVHRMDESGALGDVQPEDEFKKSYKSMVEIRKEKAKQQSKDTLSEIEIAFDGLVNDEGVASAIDIAEQIGVSPDTLKRWFGKGKRGRAEYRQFFETFEGENDKRLYLRRKTDDTDGTEN